MPISLYIKINVKLFFNIMMISIGVLLSFILVDLYYSNLQKVNIWYGNIDEIIWMTELDSSINDEFLHLYNDGGLSEYDYDRIHGKFYLYILNNPDKMNLIYTPEYKRRPIN